MYVFDKSILKSFNNVYQKKIILKTHLLIKNILSSLQKLFQCNNNLSKHQTKISTVINTNLLNELITKELNPRNNSLLQKIN